MNKRVRHIGERHGLPLQRFAERTVPDLLDRSQAFGGERPILVATSPATTLTYEEFLGRVAGTAAALAGSLKPGTRVACLLANSAEYLVLRYALACSNLVEVAINGKHKGALLRHMLEVSRPGAVIVADRYGDNLASCGFDLRALTVIDERSLARMTAARIRWRDRPNCTIAPGDPCRILFTSGTSGSSKAVELSHAYEVYTGERHVELIDIGPSDRWLYVTPMFHIDSLYIFSILLHTGGGLALAPDFSASRFWNDVEHTQATFLCYVGSILPILLKGSGPARTPSLRFAVGGGATPEQIELFERRFGVKVLEGFAMTECIACTFSTMEARRRGSVGKPVDGYEVAILDQAGRPLPPGAAGEIAVRAQEPCGLFTAYFGNPAATAEAMRGGWFHTGDLGACDAEGYFYYRGRIKDAIRVGGENVSAMELEAIADEHPCVRISAAVPVPAELGEDDILLYVEPRRGSDLDGQSLFGYLADRAASFMVPRYIRLVDRLPRTATEKVQKSELARRIDANTLRRDADK